MTSKSKSTGLDERGLISSTYFTVDGLFHYTACGLDNVYLKGGFVLSADGMSYAIERLEELHDCVSMALIKGTHDLNGREFRFLRKELCLTQAQVAKLMGVDAQTVARWENGKNKSPIADRLIRTLYMSIKHPEDGKNIDTVLNDISDLDIKEHREWLFEQNTKWHKCAA